MEGAWTGIVNRLSDSAPVGTFEPGPTVAVVEKTGWVDILTGITAFRPSNGQCLVLIGDDYRAKAILYRWTPPK